MALNGKALLLQILPLSYSHSAPLCLTSVTSIVFLPVCITNSGFEMKSRCDSSVDFQLHFEGHHKSVVITVCINQGSKVIGQNNTVVNVLVTCVFDT